MDSNTSSTELPVALGPLASAVEALAEEDLTRLPDAHAAQRVLALRSLMERLEGQWLRELAAVDARGAAGAEQGVQAPSTAGWLRRRARLGAADAHQRLRLARGTQGLPGSTVVDAEPVLVAAACRLDPPRLRRLVAHLAAVADPDAADAQAQRQHGRRGIWVSPP